MQLKPLSGLSQEFEIFSQFHLIVMFSLNVSLNESSTPVDLVTTVTGNRNTFYVLGLNVVFNHPVVAFFFTNLANFLFSSIWKCVLALSHH